MKQLQILLAARDQADLAGVAAVLVEDRRFALHWRDTAATTLEAIENNRIDVIIAAEELADATGRELITRVVAANPFINSALVSPLEAAEFHEVTEGLGIFCQLPVAPDQKAAQEMIELLDRIYQL